MCIRPDISSKVVHFTSGENDEQACDRLQQVLNERVLKSGNRNIRGGFSCICFTEAPLASLSDGLVNPTAYSRYSPFGLMFEKTWLFQNGGRPVIYQPEIEYELLPEAIRWRHVRYEPDEVDFTWEREWRLLANELPFDPFNVALIVPNADWIERLRVDHDNEQDWQVLQYALAIDEEIAELNRQEFPWTVLTLE